MSSSDLLLMPSLSEGLPVAAVEAAARGLAIVGSDIPGLRDVLEDGVNGWLLPVSNEGAWEKALGAVMGSRDELKQRQEASLRMAEKFDLGAIADAYEETLLTAVTSKNQVGR